MKNINRFFNQYPSDSQNKAFSLGYPKDPYGKAWLYIYILSSTAEQITFYPTKYPASPML